MNKDNNNMPDLSDSIGYVNQLRDMGKGYEFIKTMTILCDVAADGNRNALSILEIMLGECQSQDKWIKANYWCSMAIRSLINTRTPESMKIILGYIRKLPENTPFGAIDLISSLLPVYRQIILGPAKDLAMQSSRSVLKAIGLQTLCNMYLEGSLTGENALHLYKLIEDFKGDRYLTQHHVELVRSYRYSLDRAEQEKTFIPVTDQMTDDTYDEYADDTDRLLSDIMSELD